MRAVLLVICMLAGAVASVASIDSAARSAGFAPGPSPLAAALRIVGHLQGIQVRREHGGAVEIAYAGDSTIVGYTWGRQLPNRLQTRLRADIGATARVNVTSLGFPGMGIHAYALLTDVIVEARPDILVWQIALKHASTDWIRGNTRGELGGWISGERLLPFIVEGRLPGGLTADSLLAHQAWVRFAGPQTWSTTRDALSRVGTLPAQLSARLAGDADPLERHKKATRFSRRVAQSPPGRLNRYNSARSRRQFDAALRGLDASHPTVLALADAVSRIARSGTRVIVYLNPFNHEHLNAVDAYDAVAFDQSIGHLGSAVIESGGTFLDLSRLLGDADFKDGTGHFLEGHGHAGTDRVLNAVSAAIERSLTEALPADLRVD
jgi:hypothetical protein